MGMREEIQADLAEAFDDPDSLADAVRPVAGSRAIKGGYDPDLGGTVPASTLHYSGRGVFGSYLAKEIDGSRIQTEDVKLLVLQNELLEQHDGQTSDVLVTPKIGDLVSGFRTLDVSEDPARATWTIQLRK